MRKSNKKYKSLKNFNILEQYALGSTLPSIDQAMQVSQMLDKSLGDPAGQFIADKTTNKYGKQSAAGAFGQGFAENALGPMGPVGGIISGVGNLLTLKSKNKEAEELENLENQRIRLGQTSQINNQINSTLIPNIPTFMCGGKMKKYPNGGSLPKLGDIAGLDTTQTDLLAEDRKFLYNVPDVNDPSIYERFNTPQAAANVSTLLNESGTPQALNTRKQFINNWNTKYGKELGLANPDAPKWDFMKPGEMLPSKELQYNKLYSNYFPKPQEQTQARYLGNGALGVKAEGGIINYSGQTHDGPDQGIPVDAQGNPVIVSKNKPVALTEDKEVTWLTPEGDSYVFSHRLGYSDKANKVISKYKKRLGGKLDGVDDLAWKGLTNDLSKLSEQQEIERETRVNKLNSKIDKYKKEMGSYINLVQHGHGGNLEYPMSQMEDGSYINLIDSNDNELKKGGWIQESINPEHKGYCTPMTKSTCTPHRKALAMRFKSGDLSKKGSGGAVMESYENGTPGYVGYDPYGIGAASVGAANATQFANAEQPEQNLFTGNVSPLGMVGSLLGNAYLMSKEKAQQVNLPTVMAEQISLANQRANAKENYINARANMMNRLKSAGLSPTQYAQSIMGSTADLNTLANQTLGQSYETEANTNVGLRNQAAMQNANFAAQEALTNAQALQDLNNRKQQYRSAMVQAPLNYLSELGTSKQYYDTLNAEGKTGLYNAPNTTLAEKILGLKKYQIKAKK